MAFDDFDRNISTALFGKFGKDASFVSGQAPGVPVKAVVHFNTAQFSDVQERASIAARTVGLLLAQVPLAKKGDRIIVGGVDYTWESEIERDDVIIIGRVRKTTK